MLRNSLIRHFTHLNIPREIWFFDTISVMARILWSEIRSLHDMRIGGCYASDEYLCEFLGLKKRQLHNLFKELKDANLMKIIKDETKFIRCALVPDVKYQHTEEEMQTILEDYQNKCCPEPETNFQNGSAKNCKKNHQNAKNCNAPMQKIAMAPLYIESKEIYNDGAASISSTPPTRSDNFSCHERTSTTDNIYIVVFNWESGKFKGVTEKHLQDWKAAFPSVNLTTFLPFVEQKIHSQPSRYKRRKDIIRTILEFLKREQQSLESKAVRLESNYSKNSNYIFERKNKLPDLFRNLSVKGSYVIDIQTQKDLSLNMDHAAFKERFSEVFCKSEKTTQSNEVIKQNKEIAKQFIEALKEDKITPMLSDNSIMLSIRKPYSTSIPVPLFQSSQDFRSHLDQAFKSIIKIINGERS